MIHGHLYFLQENHFLLRKSFRLISLLILLLFLFGSVFAQNYKAGVREELDRMFSQLDRSSVPTGLLRDYAIEYEDLDYFSGLSTLDDTNLLTSLRYGDFLSTIQSSCINKNDSEKLGQKFRGLLKEENGTHLSIALYKYSRIRADALTSNLIKYENGRVYNRAGINPYQEEVAFAACVQNSNIATSSVVIEFSEEFLFSNCDIDKIEISYKGRSYEIVHGAKISLNLDQGENKITVTVKANGGQSYRSHFCLYHSRIENQQMRSLAFDPLRHPDEHFLVTGDSYNGITTKADVYIKYAGENNTLKRPLIVVEGFDPRLPTNPEGFWNYFMLNRSLLEFASLNGFDIVYVDWVQPEEYIQANALTLQKVIERINQRKSKSEHGNIILAHSMGGLVSRYALKTMENRGIKHQVDKYISYDVPHLGAHIPIGVLYGFHGIQKFIESRGLAGEMALSFGGFSDLLVLGKKLAYSTSAQQMLINYVDPAGNFNNQEHLTWQKELEHLGFPNGDPGRPIQLLAIANGSYNEFTLPKWYLHTNFEAGTSVLPAVYTLAYCINPRLAGAAVGVVSLALNDILSGLLTILPGRSSIQGHCDFFPAKSPGALVTDIEMTYKNKFLWMLPITRTLFSFSRYSPISLSFEKFPGSTYSLSRDSKSRPLVAMHNDGGFGPIYDYEYDIEVYSKISFIPTSSALAVGSGINMNQEQFYVQPKGAQSPFGENYYIHRFSDSHVYFTEPGIGWICSQLKASITGPELGYTGAQYTVSGSNIHAVSWRTSNPIVATINRQGVLSVKGEGEVSITAICNGVSYTKRIIVGIPRCVLVCTHSPGGYKITASTINEKYSDNLHRLSGYIKYKWGIKKSQSSVVWRETTSPQLTLRTDPDDNQIVILLEISDIYGNKLPMVHSKIQHRSLYYTSYPHLFFSSTDELFEENMEPYTFDIAYINLIEREDLPPQYQSSDWIPFTAMILSPSGRRFEVELENNEIAVRNILNREERMWIHSHAKASQNLIYMIELQNLDKKFIQYLPIRFTYIKR